MKKYSTIKEALSMLLQSIMAYEDITMTERELIRECINGNRLSQRKLYDMHSPLMFSICLRYAGNYADACDMLQDSFIKVFDNLHKFDFQGTFQGWIRRVVVNTCIDFHRYKKHNLSFETIENTNSYLTTVNNEVILRLSSEDMLKAIQKLPTTQRIIISLYAIDGYEHSEIAGILRITESASRSMLAKARKSLSEKFKSIMTIAAL